MNPVDLNKKNHKVSNFLGGTWVKGNGEYREVISPYTGKLCGHVSFANIADVEMGIIAAKKAQKDWALVPLKSRTQILFGFRDILQRDLQEIAELIALESGKTVAEAKAEVLKGIEVLEFALSLQNLDLGGRMEVSRGVFCEYQRSPLGVVASITPFNFPAMVPMWTIPIAIALGNAYIWKPSEKTPLTSLYIADALSESGLPAGILTVLHGDADVAQTIIEHKDVRAVSFVGSTKIAKNVYEKTTSLGKRALCLGGAKNHITLLPDADLELSGSGISDSFTGCAGQRCMAASVLLAVGDVEKHIEKIKERAKSQILGEMMGAIITAEQLIFINKSIEQAVIDGATILLDGRDIKKPQGMEEGFWIGPTILDHVKPGTTAAVVEIFGPVLSIIRCQNVTEAISIQNSSPYGNAASVFTSSGPMAQYVAQATECGMFGVNIGVPVPREPFSFGGVKASKFGHGDITGIHSLDFWSDVRKITTKWEMQSDATWMS